MRALSSRPVILVGAGNRRLAKISKLILNPFLISMRGELPYQLLADAVLTLHAAVVLFVVGGLVLIVLGNVWNWRWVNSMSFRLAHLAAIAVVVAETWIGLACPLTTLEMWLRARSDAATYGGSFIEHWVQRMLYYDAPSWVFTLGYTLFGALVIATWWYFPPTVNRYHDKRHRSAR